MQLSSRDTLKQDNYNMSRKMGYDLDSESDTEDTMDDSYENDSLLYEDRDEMTDE